ncbi:ETC complex I subunit-like protein [Rhodothalassium salexigens DSM 2132]|uniref:ETC complex I subunit-like protein n=1 Tax=Rhodothalassium salexigens DSM 2132 TaxID=1188247 RepID=A0A4R2PBX2_RHOSA|nr:ETC complex I subunit [Rhodothalassium salexigens]MBB4212209.1 hypothetical protein [Rhodothalassium salexigens DSM 2132]MBK1639684.1 hypothetical protein [Rhodothalassium salexigens DSM 2132]TCP32640.1 ETC complex I subunit-like protein [Rhodothalassium salexigens DSM 2132]
MDARIYRPAKTAMQSGRAKTKHWVLEYERQDRTRRDPLMGWAQSADTRRQIRLEFDTKEDALDYAKRHKIAARVLPDHQRRKVLKSYADNFR